MFELLRGFVSDQRFWNFVHWNKAGTVVTAIVLSILADEQHHQLPDSADQFEVPIETGARIWRRCCCTADGPAGMLASLIYFMLVKGMKNLELYQRVPRR